MLGARTNQGSGGWEEMHQKGLSRRRYENALWSERQLLRGVESRT